MKLLFDQNLSFKLCQALADIFPGECVSWPEAHELAATTTEPYVTSAIVNGGHTC